MQYVPDRRHYFHPRTQREAGIHEAPWAERSDRTFYPRAFIVLLMLGIVLVWLGAVALIAGGVL